MCIRGPMIKSHETSVTNFQRRFSVNVWCSVLGNKLIGPSVFDNNLTGNTYEAFLRNELPGLLKEIPLTIRSQMYFQHDGAPPHYTRHVRDYLNESFPNRWLGRGGPIQTTLHLLLNPSSIMPKIALQLVEDTLNNYCKAGTVF